MSERPQAFSSVNRKAAKQHRCCECDVIIEKGDKYQYSSGIWEGRASSFKQCLNCSEIMRAAASAAEYDDELPAFGDLRIWFENFQCRGFAGTEWLNGMAEEIKVEPEKLNRLLRV